MYIGELKLERVNYKDKKHLLFLKELMNSSNMDYLWDISDSNLDINNNRSRFIILNNRKENIGYINISQVTDAYYGKTVSIYYAVSESKRRNNYGFKIVDNLSDYLFAQKDIDCIVAQVDTTNIASQKVLLKSGYNKLYEDDDEIKFVRLKKNA